jgi:DNA-binding ferritin-like protein
MAIVLTILGYEGLFQYLRKKIKETYSSKVMDKAEYRQKSLDFVNVLESFKTKYKALHWAAPQLTYHKEIDEFLNDLMEFQDEIAECSQGYFGGQFGPNEIQGTAYAYLDALTATFELQKHVDNFYMSIKDDNTLQGIVNIVNDFQQELLQTIYLFRLASKDGNPDNIQDKPIEQKATANSQRVYKVT